MSDLEWVVTDGVHEAELGDFYLCVIGALGGLFEARVESHDELVLSTNLALDSLEQAKAWAEAIARVPS